MVHCDDRRYVGPPTYLRNEGLKPVFRGMAASRFVRET